MSILYIGGSFHAVDNVSITSGLAMWSKHTGLIDFPGGSVLHSDGGVSNTQVKAMAYEPRSEVKKYISHFIYLWTLYASLFEYKHFLLVLCLVAQSLFISGQFRRINDRECNGVAVWNR